MPDVAGVQTRFAIPAGVAGRDRMPARAGAGAMMFEVGDLERFEPAHVPGHQRQAPMDVQVVQNEVGRAGRSRPRRHRHQDRQPVDGVPPA